LVLKSENPAGLVPNRRAVFARRLVHIVLSLLKSRIFFGKGTSLREPRDPAILLLGLSGAFRRSELVALNLGDIEWTTEGALVTIRRSKADQEGLGRRVGIPRVTSHVQ
jgi:hypothetical protein